MTQNPKPSQTEPRSRLIQAITAPLGFYVLALLIVESYLAAVLIGADLEKSGTFIGMWTGVALFVLVIFLVFLLVWFKPENLTFSEESHIEARRILGETPSPERGPTKRKKSHTKKPRAKALEPEGATT